MKDPQQATRSRNFYSPVITVPGLNLDWKVSDQFSLNVITSAVLGTRNSVQFLGLATVPDTINAATNEYNPRQVDIDEFNSYNAEVRGIYDYHLGSMDNKITSGVRIINNDLHRRQQGPGTTGVEYDLTTTGDFKRNVHYKSHTYAIFFENLFGITKNFSVTPGVRFEFGASDLSGFITYYPEDNLPQQIDHNFPLFGIRGEYKINDRNNIYGGWSQAYRPMILKDIIPATVQDVIDPDLEDATGWNAELGIRGKIQKWLTYDVSGFAVQYNNRIGTLVQENDTGTTYFYKTNVGNSLHTGVEVFAELAPFEQSSQRDWIKGWSVYTSSSYIHARYTEGTVAKNGENVSIEGNHVESVPDWNIRTGLSYKLQGFSATLLYSYVSESFADALNTLEPNASGTLGLVPSYSLVDFNAAYYYRNVNFRVSVSNLTDLEYFTKRPTFYPDPGIWPGDGRTVIFSFGVKI